MAKKKPIVSKEGQWKYPGQETIIPNANGRITMQGVPYPVLGIDDLGNQQMMMPGAEYQFPGNSVYEIPMAKKGGTKKVKIKSLPKAQNGEEVQTVYTAGTNEPWEPLPEMTPAEAKQWGRLRDDAIGITGNYATNAQIYATYKRAKEMGLGYDDYVSKEKAKAQQQRDAVVPKPIPGWDLSLEQLKQLSSLPGSPIMYNRATGEYSLPNLEMYDPKVLIYAGANPITRGESALYYDPKMYDFRAERISERNAQNIADLNSGKLNPQTWEAIYDAPYDPSKNYTVTGDELRQHHWTGPSDDLRSRGADEFYFDGYEFVKYNSPNYLTYTHHLNPDEKILQDAYAESKKDMHTPLAKFLGSKGEPPKSVLERNYRISADKFAKNSILGLESIIGAPVNSEAVRSVLDMDPKIFEDIINSPFKSGSIILDSNNHGWGKKLTISDKEAEAILRNIEFIKRSGKYNFLLDPSPADMAIQGIGNTLSWMAGNDNAEGPGTIGEAFHNFTGNTAHNKGYNLFNTFESPLVAGRNIVENITAPILSGYDGGTGIHTLDKPGVDFFTEVPTMRGMNMTWNPNYSQLENDIANFTYTAAQDAALSGIGAYARPFVNKAINTIGATFGNSFLADNPRSYMPNSSIANRVRHSFEPEIGMNMSNYEVAENLAKNKSKYLSPFDITKYNFAPGAPTGQLRGKPLFKDRDISNFAFGTNRKVLTEEGAKYFNKKYGLNYKELDQISDSDLKLHVSDVFDHYAPKPSKKPGSVKFKPNFINDLGEADQGFKFSSKWTKDQLADAKRTALDFDSSDLDLAGNLRKDIGAQSAKGVLYGLTGIGGTLVGNRLVDAYGKPLYNKAVPYLNAGARKLGINSNPFSLATQSGANSTEGIRNQVMMSLNDEGNTVSSARVNESAEGDVIIGGEFIEDANNTVNKASWFKENPKTPVSDKNFTAEEAKGFYGVEDGKFKAGKLEDFKPETVVVPIRPFENSYEPVRQAGVTGGNTLRLVTDPKDPNNSESGIIYNNAPQSGKMIFYSPSTKNAWFIYNADPAVTAEQINKLIQENSDIRYIPIDNGRYEHYIDKSEGLLSEDDFKQYYSADVDRQGNPGYNIVLKRKGKKLGGPIYRTGGELPKAQYGPPTAQDSAMVANRANEVGRYLANNGYLQVSSDPARFANRNDFRQDLEGGGRRFQNANVAGNIIDFTSGNQGRFPGNYTEGYTGYTPAWFQRDLAPGVLNPNVPLSYYDTRILPQRFDVYESVIDPVNAVNNRTSGRVKDVLGKYTYEKLAVTPWKKLTIEQKIKRLKRYGASGSPYDDPKVGIRELKGILEEEKTKKIAKVEPPVVDKPVQIPSQPEDVKIPFKADITRRQYPITLTGDEALDRLNQQLYGNFGTLTEDGYIPTDDPKYYPYRGIGPGTPEMRRSYGKFEKGGELPKAQNGLRKVVYNDPKQFKIANQAYKDSMDLYNIGNQEKEAYMNMLSQYNLDPRYIYNMNPQGKPNSRHHNKIAPILYSEIDDVGGGYTPGSGSYSYYRKNDGSDLKVSSADPLNNKLQTVYSTYKKPQTRPVFEEVPNPEMIDIKPFAMPQVGLKPQLGNIPQLPIPQTNKQRVIINTPQGDKIRVQDPKTKKFMWWEDEKGLPTDIENPTGIPYYDFKFANGGSLTKAQFGYETSVEKDRSGAPWVQNDPYLHNFNTVDVPENLSELPSYRGYTFAKGDFHPMTAFGDATSYEAGYTKFDDKTGYMYQPNTENLQDFQSLPMEGDAEFNLRRFVLNPYEGQEQTHDVYTRRDASGNVINDKKNFIPKSYSKEETMDNVFKDLYGQNLYKFKGNRDAAYDATKEFMKNRVEPQYNGKYYEFMNNPDVSLFDKQNIGSGSKMTVYDSSAKDHLFSHFVTELYEGKDRDYLFNLGDDERMDELNKRVYGDPKFKERLDSYNEALQDWYVTNKHMTPEQAKLQVESNLYKNTPWDRVRKSTGKFQRGGDISIPDLRRVKISKLPKAQSGINWSNPFKSSFPEQPKSDWYNAMNTVMPPKENFDWRSTIENVAKPKPYTLPDEYFNELKILENSVKEGYRDGRFYPYDSPEKGNPTIGYGHKLTEKDIKSGRFKEGLLEKEAEDLMRQDVNSHRQLAIDRYDTRYGKGAFNKLHPDLKQLAIDFTYNGIDFTATGEDYKNSFPTFWTAANEYSTAQDAAIKQKALETMLANYQRGFKGKVLGERNVYTQKILNNLKKTGGELPKAQNGTLDWREFLTRNMTPAQNLVGDVRKVNMQPTVAESTRPANMPKAPTEWKGKSGKKIIEEAKAQEAYNALPEELKRRDVLTADTRSDAEKFARRAWTAVSQPMETIAAINRGYDIPSGYMGMHDAYEGYGVGSPMTSVVDMVAGTPGFIGNAFYRQGEQIVDDPLGYALTNTLGLLDPDTRDKAIANYFDLTAVIPAARVAAGPLARGIKSAKQSFIYNAVDPVGYGMGQKILMAPETLYKNIMTPDARPKRVGNLLIPGTTDPSASAIEQLGKNRLDAWAKYLGTKEKYGVFQPNYEGQFTFNAPVSPLKFASLYNDILAAKIKNSGSGFYFKEDLVDLTKKFNRAIHGDPEASKLQYKLNTFLDEQGMTKPWEQTRKTAKSDVEGFDDIVFDYDENAVMGGHHYKVTKTPEGYLHFQANDTWDLHPFERRGNANILDDDFTKRMREQHYVKALRNLEMGKLLGGKPFDIKINYLVDPRTFKTIKTWRDGGELNIAQKGGSNFKTKLNPQEEQQFKHFYQTLPGNLREDDATYDTRGYWDASGRPSEFDYSQPTDEDGYYHAFSRHPETGKILKSPGHPTFKYAVDKTPIDGNTYVPTVGVDGNVYMRDLNQDAESLQRQKGGPAKRFNTKLRGQAAEAFNQHALQFPSLINDAYDYDTRGFYKEIYNTNNGDMAKITGALTPGSETAHVGTDRYKKPNHPTFSKESKYHVPILRPAGEWGHNEEGNYDYFNASRRNIKNMIKSDGSPLDYFKRAEDYNQDGTPDVKLFYKGQPMFKEGGLVKKVKINSLPNNWKNK